MHENTAFLFLGLVKRGADWRMPDRNGVTPLDQLITATDKDEMRGPIAIHLINELAEQDVIAVVTSLRYFVLYNEYRHLLREAIAKGWNPEQPSVPLMLFLLELKVTSDQAADWFRFLLDELHLNPNQQHPHLYETALFLVEDPELVHLLVSRGADAGHKMRNGETALLQAIGLVKSWKLIRALIQYGQLDTPGSAGITPRQAPEKWLVHDEDLAQMKRDLQQDEE